MLARARAFNPMEGEFKDTLSPKTVVVTGDPTPLHNRLEEVLRQDGLLRVIETGTFRRVGGTEELTTDARFIAASNRDLADAVEAGELREDLFYRLDVFHLRLPSLREGLPRPRRRLNPARRRITSIFSNGPGNRTTLFRTTGSPGWSKAPNASRQPGGRRPGT